MNARPRFPLVLKLLGWLLLHLLLLAVAFFGFLSWQLGLGLDSLLSGAAGERLGVLGEQCRAEMIKRPPSGWNEVLRPVAEGKSLAIGVYREDLGDAGGLVVPGNVRERAAMLFPRRLGEGPPERRGPGPDGGRGFGPPEGGPRQPPRPMDGPLPGLVQTEGAPPLPAPKAVFLMRGDHGDGYWAGIQVAMPTPRGQLPRNELLLVRSDKIDGAGLFFELKPWLLGGLAVLGMSLLFWAPFVLAITRYLRRLTDATGEIAAGRFKVSLPSRDNDELGQLGQAIQTMADRLDHLVSGQKRFLGDAAHELCAPLARVRTGLGILEHQIPSAQQDRLIAIEEDAAELAQLIGELLEFSRAGSREPKLEVIDLRKLAAELVSRDGDPGHTTIRITEGTLVAADRAFLARAISNLIRNSILHAGAGAHLTLKAEQTHEATTLIVSDNGAGVPETELPRLFEPFYRPDRSRSRQTGGSGLGLAIVRAAVEASGGKVSAFLPEGSGFAVVLTMPTVAGKLA
jgi:two-component system sensor histidine kinase CpxA